MIQFELNTGVIFASVLGLAFLGWNLYLQSKFRAITKLFEKVDALEKELQAYKLHVAETYVNREALREILAPLKKSIDEVKEDLDAIRNKMMGG